MMDQARSVRRRYFRGTDKLDRSEREGPHEIVNRPKDEPGFRLDRQEGVGRTMHYATRGYAAMKPEGERYG